MRTGLAEKLLIEIMNWSNEEVKKERPLLQAMSSFKYDEYQQFSIGTLFIESLVKWLNQFDTIEERNTAYNFIKENLIFFSNNQILHLVNTTFNTIIEPILIDKAANILDINRYSVGKIINEPVFTKISRRSLYIGLSDGARIDQLRRSSKLNNEQVIPTYEVSKNKVDDMLEELAETGETNKFDTIFLVDDFTASGTSYFRKEEDIWKGKIYKTVSAFFDKKTPLSRLVDITKEIDINLIFYVATTEAVQKIENLKNEVLKEAKFKKLNFNIHVVQPIDSSIKDKIISKEKDFIELSKKHIDESIIDRHFKKAKHKDYYLGYNECCLPIILAHNTPNNSLPLLWWFSEEKKFAGLFPRVTRHS
ncbi:hypothetical protein [Psychroserpens algicola]|uniref:PRTase-CE domain-containing protein n=1 Tax=Psychroserpens algicola TaxID=1719034 RepID=A0ABT0HBZ7_9FLAO|nr:hypothetical protein [Psychroserpens algicola]MCK8481841.1 hypothetical protein [Psychroserpens algicola]